MNAQEIGTAASSFMRKTTIAHILYAQTSFLPP
jgi:hypothetical protein